MHNLHYITIQNKLQNLPVRFTQLNSIKSLKAFSDPSVIDKRLASFQYFAHCRIPKELHERRTFYRNGYIFLGPEDMIDKYESSPNKPW
jgi:hypothetical protein